MPQTRQKKAIVAQQRHRRTRLNKTADFRGGIRANINLATLNDSNLESQRDPDNEIV